MRSVFIFTLLFASFVQAQNYGGPIGGGSCSIGERQAWCRDLSTNPSQDRQVDINACSVSCSQNSRPICIAGYLTGSHCNDPIEPSQCYCVSN